MTIKTIGKGSYGTVDLVKRKENHKLSVAGCWGGGGGGGGGGALLVWLT